MSALSTLTFLPDGLTATAADGESVLDVARRLRLFVETDCGGEGTCGKCALRVMGAAPAATAADERHLTHAQLDDGWRLSCQVQPAALDGQLNGALVIQLVHQLQSVKTGAGLLGGALALRPRVRRVAVRLDEPSLADQRSDAQRLEAALAAKRFHARATPAALRALPAAARAAAGLVTATVAGGHILGVEPGDASARCYGVAFDVGTTTVVGTLLDLNRGVPLATAAMLNPQATYGADVISRINRAIADLEGLARLHAGAVQAVREIATRLAADAAISMADVWELTFAGNTSMLHLLMDVDPHYLAPSPFIPVTTDAQTMTVGDLLDAPSPPASTLPLHGVERGTGGEALRSEALCYVLPGVASFVGADAVAVAVATGMGSADALTLAIDIGTNGEILLGSRQRLLACSAAAGPAFEGAHIRFGMRGTPGAIEHVRLVGGDLRYDVIGGGQARGICGSGLVDLVAVLCRAGLIQETGRLLPPDEAVQVASPALGGRVVRGAAGVEFMLVPPAGDEPAITLGQRDVRELQLAKGALRAGVEVLLRRLGKTTADLERVCLAGAFGSYITPEAARTIGLLPPVPLARVEGVGNAAGRGSLMALASTDVRREAETLARRIEYVELSADPTFTDAFMDAMAFPDVADLTP